MSLTPCKKCSKAQPRDAFYIDKRYGTVKQPCKSCWNGQWSIDPELRRKSRQRWEKDNPKKLAAKDRGRRDKLQSDGTLREIDRSKNLWRYRITPDDFSAMMDAQGGVCACCGLPPKDGEVLHVDHDHDCCPRNKSCGKCIRGLVHNSCNRGIGLLGDDPDALTTAAYHVLSNRDLLRPMLTALQDGNLDGIEL